MAIESTPGLASGNANFSDKLSGTVTKVRATAADLDRTMTDTSDQVRASAAAGVSSAAGAIEDGAAEAGNRVSRAAHATAKALSSGADYIRDNSARDMVADAMGVVKNNPGVALLAAVAIGFLVGRALSSRK